MGVTWTPTNKVLWGSEGSWIHSYSYSSFGEKHFSALCLVWSWHSNSNVILAMVMHYYFHNLYTDLTSAELGNFGCFAYFTDDFQVCSDFVCPSIVTQCFSHKIWNLIRINSFQFTRLHKESISDMHHHKNGWHLKGLLSLRNTLVLLLIFYHIEWKNQNW